MEATPTDNADRPDGGKWHIRLVPNAGNRFRFVDENGQPRDDPGDDYCSGDVLWVGDRGETRIPEGASAHLPYQPDHTLLDMTLPPHPELSNVRSGGGYLLHLTTQRGSATTGGYFEEFTPQTVQPEG